MTDREICEQIVNQGNCTGVKCKEHDCPIDCCGDFANVVGYAKKWLAEHPITERKLNEQWVKDGHMYKAVPKGSGNNFACSWAGLELAEGLIAIDLGPVNEEGVLACPFCGEYLDIIEWPNGFYLKHKDKPDCILGVTNSFPTKQACIDACNRRA